MTKKRSIRWIALMLALLMPVVTALATTASAETETVSSNSSKYESPDINSLMGAGEEPEELSVSAGATYQEKAWYEYVMYSEHAVASYRLDDDHRLLFYDPYTYTNSMIMDVQFDATTMQFDTMSEYSISHTVGKTISACVESTYTNTTATQTSGRDITHSDVKNNGSTKTIYNHSIDVETSGSKTEKDKTEYHYGYGVLGELKFSEEAEFGVNPLELGKVTVGSEQVFKDAMYTDYTETTHKTEYSPDYKTSTKTVGDDTVEYNTSSTTDGWTELSARVTTTIGSSSSTSRSWSENESTTTTKIYAATHFASDGVTPLPWAIVHYQVQMPMKCCMQIRHSGEWVTLSTAYCLLTTVQGTCRAWMQGGQVYYEDWGNGEPVVATDFWSQFMTKDQLIDAYQDKLYPVGGGD